MAEEEKKKEEEGSTLETKGGDDKTFTQADLDRVVTDRLKREWAKFADYDDLKAKAADADKVKESGKGESQKLTEQLAKMQTDLDEERRQRRVIEVAADKGLTPAHVKRLSGFTKEELAASADELLEDFPIPEGEAEKKAPPLGGKPREQLRSGSGDPDAPVEETDLKKLGERMFSR